MMGFRRKRSRRDGAQAGLAGFLTRVRLGLALPAAVDLAAPAAGAANRWFTLFAGVPGADPMLAIRREVAEHMGAQAYMVDSAADLRPEWIAGKRRIGVSAGASAPEVLVIELIERLKALGAKRVQQLDGITEHVVFTLPRELARERT